MGKVTIYNSGGDVYREIECVKIEPWLGQMTHLITVDGDSILTDLPVVGCDLFVYREEPDDRAKENTFDVELVLGGGGTRFRRKWTGASWLVHIGQPGIYGFWHGDKMVYVAGPVLIDNFAGPNPYFPKMLKGSQPEHAET